MPGAIRSTHDSGQYSGLFPPGYHSSGLLLHVTSLPSRYGIGDFGPGAFEWIDRLHAAGQGWWQALPLGPPDHFNSPYQSLSTFAGNGLLISPDLLIVDGLLRVEECAGTFSSTAIDYDVVIPFKRGLLRYAWSRFRAGGRADLVPAYEQFCHEQASWLEDYALFRALKRKFDDQYYLDWPAELIYRVPSALARARDELAPDIDQIRFAQFLVFRQARNLKEYARAKGIKLIGDLPFFVSGDSSDVWAHPEVFLLDEQRRPRAVAGVPPDYFSAKGQLWGNPVYDWDACGRTGYAWWMDRIAALLSAVDVIRLDHFRAFAAAWHVPADAVTAETGDWVPGPGPEFFLTVQERFGAVPFIAEDLGLITPDVIDLRERFGLPGMRVLQFAFDGAGRNPHLPENYSTNDVVYTGTHDNATARQWFEGLAESDRRFFWRYVGRLGDVRDVAPELIRIAWYSRAALAIAPLQDLLNLGRDARMNVPGQAEGNWRWRATQDMLGAWNFSWLRNLTATSGRSDCVERTIAVAL